MCQPAHQYNVLLMVKRQACHPLLSPLLHPLHLELSSNLCNRCGMPIRLGVNIFLLTLTHMLEAADLLTYCHIAQSLENPGQQRPVWLWRKQGMVVPHLLYLGNKRQIFRLFVNSLEWLLIIGWLQWRSMAREAVTCAQLRLWEATR